MEVDLYVSVTLELQTEVEAYLSQRTAFVGRSVRDKEKEVVPGN